MGADNWAICPACKSKAIKAKEKERAKAAEAYGKIPSDEWQVKSTAAWKDIELKETLREDYEIGVDECGEFNVSYRSGCSICDFRFDYEETKQVFSEKQKARA